MKSPKVSIIIPVYNGENYIRETLDSLLAQTYKNWELVCVDDSSSDLSYSILKEYELNDDRIKVFQKVNERIAAKGVKYGLSFATGDYMMYSSQDDLFSDDLLDKAIEKAIKTDSDYVLFKTKWYHGKNDIREGCNGINGNVDIVLTGREALLLSLDWRIHGAGLLRMSLVRRIGWYDYGYDSDEYTTRLLFLNSNKIVFSEGIFYYRQNNPNAITIKFSTIQFDALTTCFNLEKLLIDNCFSEEDLNFIRRITFNKLTFSIKQFYRHLSTISTTEKIRIRKLLRISFKRLNKSFMGVDESRKLINKSFFIYSRYYYFKELRRSNRYFIKLTNICKLNF